MLLDAKSGTIVSSHGTGQLIVDPSTVALLFSFSVFPTAPTLTTTNPLLPQPFGKLMYGTLIVSSAY